MDTGPTCEDGESPSVVDPDTTDDFTETVNDDPTGGATVTMADDDSTTSDKLPMELTVTVSPSTDGQGNPPSLTVTVTTEDGTVVDIPSDKV